MQGLDPLPSEAKGRLSNSVSSPSTGTYVPISDGHPRPRCTQATLRKRKSRLLPTNVSLAQGSTAIRDGSIPQGRQQVQHVGHTDPGSPLILSVTAAGLSYRFVHSCGVQVA